MKRLHLVMKVVALSYAALVVYCIMMLTSCGTSNHACDAYGEVKTKEKI